VSGGYGKEPDPALSRSLQDKGRYAVHPIGSRFVGSGGQLVDGHLYLVRQRAHHFQQFLSVTAGFALLPAGDYYRRFTFGEQHYFDVILEVRVEVFPDCLLVAKRDARHQTPPGPALMRRYLLIHGAGKELVLYGIALDP